MRACAAAIIVVAACSSRDPINRCDQNLHGVWVTPAGTRWMLLDNGPTLELFPLFDDGVPDGAPRLIDIKRGANETDRLAGDLSRRFTRRSAICVARARVTVTACKDDTLQLVLGEVAAPLAYEPCAWAQPAPSRVELWRRD